jgi:hypothetical protein
MDTNTNTFLEYEVRALLTRLARMKPFALQEAMVPAADISPQASSAIERHMSARRRGIRNEAERFLFWLHSPASKGVSAMDAQRRFTLLRLRFGNVLNQFDLFSDVLTQRSERDNGVWLRGLDVVAADALALPGYYETPPVVCYLDRGVGAAIRRARTRLPGGGDNPVAIIRVPRERMVGSSVASSLVHEVGHQAAALLDLVKTLRAELQTRIGTHTSNPLLDPWGYWARWISEIVADFWSVARVGICSTLGLIGVVSLPRPFVFRIGRNDPHPFPWIRVNLSCRIGQALYPHAQWSQLASLWNSFYPTINLPTEQRALLDALLATLPEFIERVLTHRNAALRGRTLASVMETQHRSPLKLASLFTAWKADPSQMYREQPAIVFAAMGQARMDQRIDAVEEGALLAKLLTHWALRSTLTSAARCSPHTATALSV